MRKDVIPLASKSHDTCAQSVSSCDIASLGLRHRARLGSTQGGAKMLQGSPVTTGSVFTIVFIVPYCRLLI